MKKIKLLSGMLGLFISFLGAGYAAWTDTLTINSTVQIGGMRVEFVQEQTKGNNDQLYNIYPNIKGNDLNNDLSDDAFKTSYEHGPVVTNFNMENLYPGVTIWYEAKIKNLGTVPAQLDNINVVFSSDTSEVLKNTIKVRGSMQHWRKQSDGTNKVISTYYLPLAGTTQYGKKSDILGNSTNGDGTGSRSGNGTADGNALVTLAELEPYVNGLINANKRVLEPGDFFTFDIEDEYKAALLQEPDLQGLTLDSQAPNCLWFTLPKDAGNDTMGQKAQFAIHFNFSQFNN